ICLYKKSGCMAAIFTFSKSLTESLAKSGRPCMAYNGGPGYFERYRKRPGAKAVHQVATAFWQKHQAMKEP
ncbi:hypothetical protein, partial [Nitrosomonas sp. Nm132]|uniref:hypothetical protein n=1 Tax=Nitrosomonas sp. Nm132 TaxID=1881053 RepID=UPI001C40AA61